MRNWLLVSSVKRKGWVGHNPVQKGNRHDELRSQSATLGPLDSAKSGAWASNQQIRREIPGKLTEQSRDLMRSNSMHASSDATAEVTIAAPADFDEFSR